MRRQEVEGVQAAGEWVNVDGQPDVYDKYTRGDALRMMNR